MKTSSLFTLAALASAGFAFGQEATTTPVGYVSLTVPAQSDSKISAPMLNAPAWVGTSTGISVDTVSVATGALTGQNFNSQYMVEITSGALIGRTFPVISNTADSVTVDPVVDQSLEVQGLLSGATFRIRPYWTLNTLFPNGQGIGSNSDPFSPVTLLLINGNEVTGINRGADKIYFHYDGSIGGDAGWYDLNNLEAGPQNSKVIYPSDVMTIRNQSASPLNVTVTGEIPVTPVANLVISTTSSNDSFAQLPYPVDTSLNQAQLFESGAVATSSDPFSPGDLLLVYNPASTGYNPGASAIYFHYDGSIGGDAGWYDLNNLEAGVVGGQSLLKAGSHIVIRKAAGPSLNANVWKAPLPYSP